MTPNRPYILRAYFDWLLDNELTPHLVVNTELPEVEVPLEFVQNGQIVLNIAPSAVMSFHMDLDAVSFSARFGGVPRQLYIPIAAIMAIYANETGAGTVFEPETAYELTASSPLSDRSNKQSSLGIVEKSVTGNEDVTKAEKPPLKASPTILKDAKEKKKGPTLTVVK